MQTTANRYFANGNLDYDTLIMSNADNLIPNSSFESYDNANNIYGWSKAIEIGKTATFALADNPKFGLKSYGISNATGWATIVSNNILISNEQNYIVSAYFRAPNFTGSSNAIIKIEYFNSGDIKIGDCYFYNQTGTAWFDAMRLETGSIITGYEYDINGNYLTKVIDPLKNIISMTYDTIGNVTSITDSKGNKNNYIYDNTNQLTQITDVKNNITTFSYDNTGNCIIIKDARNKLITYQYSEFNFISSITNPLNQAVIYDYDRNGNQKKILFPNGNLMTFNYNLSNRMDSKFYNGTQKWRYVYDASGNVININDIATSKTIIYIYDKNNNLIRQEEGTSNSIDFDYDANNNLTSIISTADSTNILTEYSYDKLNQMIAHSRNTTQHVGVIYDERGNVATIRRLNGIYTTFEYNELNKVISIRNFNMPPSPNRSYALYL